jgi:hypothetical protein
MFRLYCFFIIRYVHLLLWWYGIQGWDVHLNHTKSYVGCVVYGECTMLISIFLLRRCRYAIVRNVILHEIAHILSGAEADHGSSWKDCFEKLGGDGMIHTPITYYPNDYKYIAYCSKNCGYEKHYDIRYATYCKNCGAYIKYELNK